MTVASPRLFRAPLDYSSLTRTRNLEIKKKKNGRVNGAKMKTIKTVSNARNWI